MAYRSDVRIITTKKGFDRLKKFVEEQLNEKNEHYNLLENTDLLSVSSNAVLIGWNSIKWYENSDFEEINAIVNGLDKLESEDHAYRFARMGENYDDYDERVIDSTKKEEDYLPYIYFERYFDDDYMVNELSEYRNKRKNNDLIIEDKKEFEFYTKEEINNLLLNNERLVFADNGIDGFVVRYKDLPDFIVDMSRSMGHDCNLEVYNYPINSFTPILTTIGEFLDKCDKDVRADIIDRLIKVQTEEDTKSYKIINKDLLEEVRDEILKNDKVEILNISEYDDYDERVIDSKKKDAKDMEI